MYTEVKQAEVETGDHHSLYRCRRPRWNYLTLAPVPRHYLLYVLFAFAYLLGIRRVVFARS